MAHDNDRPRKRTVTTRRTTGDAGRRDDARPVKAHTSSSSVKAARSNRSKAVGSSGDSHRTPTSRTARSHDAKQGGGNGSKRATGAKTGNRPSKRNPDTGRNAGAGIKPRSAKGKGRGKDAGRTSVRARHVVDSKGKAVLLVLVIIIIALLCFAGVDSIRSFHRIHPGVTVGGVDVGGMSVEDAADVLDSTLGDRLEVADVVVFDSQQTADGFDPEKGVMIADAGETPTEWDITATTLGASIDGEGLARIAYQSTRGDGAFKARLKSVFGGLDIPAYVNCDYGSFYNLLSNIDNAAGTQPVDAGISIADGVVSVTQPSTGSLVDAKEFLALLSDAFLGDGGNFVAPFETASYTFDSDDAETCAQTVRDAISTDVTASYDTGSWTLTSVELGNMISTKVTNPHTTPTLTPYVDADKTTSTMSAVMGDAAATVGATDAYFDTSDGSVSIVPSSVGTGPDMALCAQDLNDVLFDSGAGSDRSITLQTTDMEPALTTQDAENMGIVELISSYSMSTADAYAEKQHNMSVACDTLSYVLIAPGATWSWNDYVGDTTEDEGYLVGHTVADGVVVSSIGGGICQVATTMFNAVYDSGLPIVERHNHSMYFANYPTGRDATISYGTYDLKWTNSTDHWILMEMRNDVDDATISCELWGTSPGYDVETDTGDWVEGEHYETKTITAAQLAASDFSPLQAGEDGKSITVVRHVYKDGTEIETDTFNSTYAPTTEVVLAE